MVCCQRIGILGDVDGWIVPVAPPPILNLASDREVRRQSLTGVGSLVGATILRGLLTAEHQLYPCRTPLFSDKLSGANAAGRGRIPTLNRLVWKHQHHEAR